MPSQFFGLNIAYTGLLASNAALNTTANNISNVQTEGYSRQQVKQQAADALRVFRTYGCAGAGVETLSIERVRDQFYNDKFWNNEQYLGEYKSKQYYMKQLEDYFDDTDSAGFKSVFDRMMLSGLEELLKDPSSATAKSQFVGLSGSLAEYFNGMYGNLQKMQKDVNSEIKLKVDEINSIAGELATLNKQINTIELAGGTANELRDKRELLVDQLSAIVDVTVTETPVYDTNDLTRETGAHRYLVKIAGGQVLVDANDFNGLECRARADYNKVNQSDIDGLFDVYWTDTDQQFNLYNAAMGGTLRGLVQMRDGNNGENFRGTIKAVSSDDVKDTVTVSVKDDYLKDLNKSNLSDSGGIIKLGTKNYYYESWTFNRTVDESGNEEYTYTFTLAGRELNPERITTDRINMQADISHSIDYQGIPYYMSQMNEWVRTFAQKVNDLLTSGYNSAGTKGAMLFTGDMATSNEQFEFEKRYDVDGDISIDVNDDSYYRLNAGNMTILSAMGLDASLLANRYEESDGVEQSDLLSDLRLLATDKNRFDYRGCAAGEFLTCVLSDIALNASGANTFTESFGNISSAINTQRLSISGVDEDEEALNLVKYQNAYNLASKMIQTFSEIYDRLILETGV
ncbi:MAG: flagellar hook-associated protein FlgK [Lachnospiraceae bacterium]|nr:flagellar hook-associated protein FlgK [Lachnospiraceae bacterium]